MMWKWLLLFIVVSAPLWALDAPTPQQIAACQGDALKLCASHIGDREAMRTCMIARKALLSQACREAFAK
jgi:hypothetical protein